MARIPVGTGWLDRRLARRAPVLDTPSPSVRGGLGVLPFFAPNDRLVDRGSPSVDVVEELQPADPAWYLVGHGRVDLAQRGAQRHGWLVGLGWRAAAGDVEARELAITALDRWLDVDRPGRGAGWVHTSDLTARLCHWLVALALLGPAVGPELRDRLAGSALLTLEHLETRLSAPGRGDPRRSLQLVGIAAGALGWPALPGAASRAGWALSALPQALDALLDDDGAPRGGAMAPLPELLTHGLLLAALGEANHAPVPSKVTAHLRRSAHLLSSLLGSDGRLPGAGAALAPPLLPLDLGPPAAAVHNACVARGWSRGPLLGDAGRLSHALVGVTSTVVEPPVAEGGRRDLQAFRAAGVVVGSTVVCGRSSRLVFSLRTGGELPGDPVAACSVLWTVGGQSVLAAPHPSRHAAGLGGNVAHLVPARPADRATLLQARITERDLCLRARAAGGGQGAHHRVVELRGPRLVVEDSFEPHRPGVLSASRLARVRVGWQLGPGWSPRWEGAELVARAGGLQLRIQLDPAITWTLVRGATATGGGWVDGPGGSAQPALLLHGEGPLLGVPAIRCSFSLS